jgi:type IV pilus assembly protein PilQ
MSTMTRLALLLALLVPSLAIAGPVKVKAAKKVTLDLQDADITNVIRLFADVGKVNFVIDDDVEGKVTMKLKNVRWTDALEVVLKSKGLGVERFGKSIYRVAKQGKLDAEERRVLDMRELERQKAPLKTKIIPVNYAKASDIAKQLEPMLTERGTVTFDERTNVVIIKDVVSAPVFRKRAR